MVTRSSLPIRPAAAALIACTLFAGPASAQGQPAPGRTADEIELFCGNVVDAARDRRYLIQKEELETLQGEVDQRIAKLEEKRQEYEVWLKRRNAFLEQAQGSLVEIYSKMRPDAASAQLKELRPELAASILMKLDAKRASIILNEMETAAAAALTTIIASASRTRDPG